MRQVIQPTKIVTVRAGQGGQEGNNKLFFLFSPRQVEEVLAEITIRPLPFAPAFLPGVTLWRGQLLPVVDLDKRFKFSAGGKRNKSRFLIVRTGAPENQADQQILRCALQLSDEIHSTQAAHESTMIDSEEIGVEPSLVRGTYQWHDDRYIVPDLVSILQNQHSITI